MVAVSTNLEAVSAFGIDPENAFGFWDWVGGRYSVCSGVGILPLALPLWIRPAGALPRRRPDIDVHLQKAPLERNLPVLLGLLSVWNVNFLDLPVQALLPTARPCSASPPTSSRWRWSRTASASCCRGSVPPYSTGGIVFGEPGTNGQHSFYQLLHRAASSPPTFHPASSAPSSPYGSTARRLQPRRADG